MGLDTQTSGLGPWRMRNLLRRNYSSRLLTADSLLRKPLLDRANADPDTLQDLDAFPVPLLPKQLSESLRKEFNEPVTCATDWSLFPGVERASEASRGDLYRAARLIHETLSSRRNRSETPSATGFRSPVRQPADPAQVRDWILKECETLYEEIKSGNTERFESTESIIPAEFAQKMTAEQLELAKPALTALAKSAKLHPQVKSEIMGHICSVIIASKSK